jgi:transcriptional regulator with XRE-family HTH domain
VTKLARTIGIRLKNAREEAGMTHQEVADRIGLTAAGYGHYERGKRLPPVDQLIKLTGVLDRSINYFLDLPADHNDLGADEEEWLRYFRAIRDPMIRQTLLRMARAAAYPGE